MDMLYQEVKRLKRDIGEVLKRYAIEKTMVTGAGWRRPRVGKEQPEVGLTAVVEETSKSGKWMPANVDRWLAEKRIRFHQSDGVDVFAHSTCVNGTTKGIIGAVVFVKVIEDLAREKKENTKRWR